jgi:hypothetical protein
MNFLRTQAVLFSILLFAPNLWAVESSSLPDLFDERSCEATCQKLENEQAILASLSHSPKCRNNPNCVTCVNQVRTGGLLKDHCDSRKLVKPARDAQYKTSGVYLAAASACAVACANSWAAKAFDTACIAGSLAAVLQDYLAGRRQVKIGNQAMDIASQLGRGGVMAIGTTRLLGSQIAQKATEKVASTLGPKASTKLKGDSCVASVLLFGAATLKAIQAGPRYQKALNQSCENIRLGSSAGNSTYQGCLARYAPETLRRERKAGIDQADENSGKTAGPSDDVGAGMTGLDTDLTNRPDIKAATAGLPGNLLRDINWDPKKAPNPGELAKKLAQGASPSQLMNEMLGDRQGGLASMFSEMEKGAREGTLTASDPLITSEALPALASGGGAGAPKLSESEENPFGLGGTDSGLAATGEEVEYRGLASGEMLDESDIWHSGDARTLFQIVSQKLHKERARLQELAPVTRHNRGVAAYQERKGQ